MMMDDMFGIPLAENQRLWEAIDAVIDAVLYNMGDQTRSIITYGGFTMGEFSETLSDIPIIVVTAKEPTPEDESQALRIKSYLERENNPLLKNVHLYFIPEVAIATNSRKGKGLHIEDTYASRFASYPLGPEDDFWITRCGMVLHGENLLGIFPNTTSEALVEKLGLDLEYLAECMKGAWPFNASTVEMPRGWQSLLARWVFWIVRALALAKKREIVTMKEAAEIFARESHPDKWKSYVSDFVAFRNQGPRREDGSNQQVGGQGSQQSGPRDGRDSGGDSRDGGRSQGAQPQPQLSGIIEPRHVAFFVEFYGWFVELMRKEYRLPPA
jgi:hypothetical protein